jgi:uncharacterized repeat protein (TIGR03803 family)
MRTLSINRIAIGLVILASWSLPAAAAATESVLHSFKTYKSAYPLGQLRFINGSLYGSSSGYWRAPTYGQIFELTNVSGSWKKTALHTFHNTDGNTPYGTVVEDSNGVLYGTTYGGDKYNGGNVFALTNSGGKWVEQTIWAFGGTGDGAQPTCDLVIDKSGDLFGTTYAGGDYNAGTVFELSKVNGVWTETVLHSFTGRNGDGWEPYAGLLMVGADTFYGTTWYGGSANGDGTVFKVFRAGGKWKEKVVYSFDGADGYEPWGTLIKDKNGGLYGTTYAGGANDEGVVFMLSASGGKWTETVLHEFNSSNEDGANPRAGLAWGSSGTLYGTTAEGGTPGYPGVGTVFELTQSGSVWTETILHSFEGSSDGSFPQGDVVVDRDGTLYGTTNAGGMKNMGTVWKISP